MGPPSLPSPFFKREHFPSLMLRHRRALPRATPPYTRSIPHPSQAWKAPDASGRPVGTWRPVPAAGAAVEASRGARAQEARSSDASWAARNPGFHVSLSIVKLWRPAVPALAPPRRLCKTHLGAGLGPWHPTAPALGGGDGFGPSSPRPQILWPWGCCFPRLSTHHHHPRVSLLSPALSNSTFT